MVAAGLAGSLSVNGHADGPARALERFEAQQPALDAAIISGEVRRSSAEGGIGVASVDVWAVDTRTGVEASRDLTDRNGHFTMSVAPGRYVVSAHRPGFLLTAYGSIPEGLPPIPLRVAAGQRHEIQLTIARGAAVTGTVRDDHGVPISHAAIAMLRASAAFDDQREAGSRVLTDANGAYRSEGLPPGEYLVAALAPGPVGVPSGGALFRTPAAQFFPGVDDAAQATRVRLAADEERNGIDVTLPRRPLTALDGVIVAPNDVRIGDGTIAIVTGAEGSPPSWDAPVVQGGRFHLLAHPGRYRVDIRAPGTPIQQPGQAAGRTYFSSAFVDLGHAVRIGERQFRLREALTVSGRIRSLEAPIAGVQVRMVPALPRQAAIRPVDAVASADGRFTAVGVAPGQYRVELIGADRSWELDSVRFRGQPQRGSVIEIEAPVDADELDVVVAPTTASLAGTIDVAGDEPSSHVIALLPEERPETRDPPLSLTRADDRGGYLFTSQRPGTYLLFLLRNPGAALLENRTLLDDLRSNPAAGVRVTLTAGTETRIDVRLSKQARRRPRPLGLLLAWMTHVPPWLK